jgi:hypothetical protein
LALELLLPTPQPLAVLKQPAWLPAQMRNQQLRAPKAPRPRTQKFASMFLVSFFLPFFYVVIA